MIDDLINKNRLNIRKTPSLVGLIDFLDNIKNLFIGVHNHSQKGIVDDLFEDVELVTKQRQRIQMIQDKRRAIEEDITQE